MAPEQTPAPASIGAWPTTRGEEGYLHVVDYSVRNRITGEVSGKSLIIRNATVLSKEEAEAIAEQTLRANEAEYPEFATLGWSLTSVNELVDWEES